MREMEESMRILACRLRIEVEFSKKGMKEVC